MLDIKYIRENTKDVQKAIKNRNVTVDLKELLAADDSRRELIQIVDKLRASMNKVSANIAKLEGKEKEAAIKKTGATKKKLGTAEKKLKKADEAFEFLMYQLPNVPFEEVPIGKDESANVVLREVGEKPKFSFTPKDVFTLGEELDLIDTKRAANVSGARFAYLKREAALLEFALVQFVFSRLTDEGWLKRVIKKAKLDVKPTTFVPMVPPVLIRPESFRAMGKLDPGQEEERFYIQKDELFLVGSAEHTVGPYHMKETLEKGALPIRYVAFSTAFRREAGTYGKDTKGTMRTHQFDKLEMFSYAHPDISKNEHDLFLAIQESLMQELELPYQVVLISTGDMAWTDAKQYDIEAWMPGQNDGKGQYRETHSTSNSTDFQARRLKTKFKTKEGNKELVHTLNGTAFSISRAPIAIIENYQQEDGSVLIPKELQPYMHGIKKISR